MVVMTAMMMMKYRHTERFVTLNKTEVVPMTKTWKFVREVLVVVLEVTMMMMMMKYSPAYRKVCDAQDDRGCTNDKGMEADEGGNGGGSDGDNDDDDGVIPVYGGDGGGGSDSSDYMTKYSPA